MAPTTVRMVLVEGQNADGATVDEDGFDVVADEESATTSAPERVIAAILGTRESAAEGDYHLAATGVTWTDPVEAAALRDALAAYKVENVMLVSAFLAAAALAQSVGSAVGYGHTGLLFLEPDAATLAVVDSADGSISDVRRRPVRSAESLTELTGLMAQLDVLESRPEGVFVVGTGVDVAAIKPHLEAATGLPVTVPEEPDMALARGAALASADAPLFASSTVAVAYSQVRDWTTAGVVEPDTADVGAGHALAYAADTDAYAALDADFSAEGRKPLLVALSVMTIFFVGVLALVVSLGIRARPAMSQQPRAAGDLVFPVKEAPAPAPPKAEVQAPPAAAPNVQPAPQMQPAPSDSVASAPAPEAPAPEAAAPAPAAPKPVPVPVAATPVPVAPAPPAAPVVPAPAAPAPAPVVPAPAAPAPAPVAPVPVPVPVAPVIPILPPVFNPPVLHPPVQSPPFQPGGGDRSGGGWPPGGGARDRGAWPPAGGGRDGGGWPPGGGWQPRGGERGGGGWLPGGAPGGGFGGNHGGFGDGPGGSGGGHGGGIGGFGGGHGGFGGGHGGR
nr:hypothetical protein [Mycobacterium noviomagense]